MILGRGLERLVNTQLQPTSERTHCGLEHSGGRACTFVPDDMTAVAYSLCISQLDIGWHIRSRLATSDRPKFDVRQVDIRMQTVSDNLAFTVHPLECKVLAVGKTSQWIRREYCRTTVQESGKVARANVLYDYCVSQARVWPSKKDFKAQQTGVLRTSSSILSAINLYNILWSRSRSPQIIVEFRFTITNGSLATTNSLSSIVAVPIKAFH